jgi:hypothetical protein
MQISRNLHNGETGNGIAYNNESFLNIGNDLPLTSRGDRDNNTYNIFGLLFPECIHKILIKFTNFIYKDEGFYGNCN